MKYKNQETTHEGIKFKSRLEKTCYDLLRIHGLPFEYEKKSYTILGGFKYPISYEKVKRRGRKVFVNNETVRATTYKPDFVGEYNGVRWIIETKGMRTTTFNIKWKMFKQKLLEKGENVLLFMPTNKTEILQSINLIKNYGEEKTITKSFNAASRIKNKGRKRAKRNSSSK